MSRSERAKMLDRVAKRAKRIKELKQKTARQIGYTQHVFSFFREMEKAYGTCNDPEYFDVMLNNAARALDERLKIIDPYIKIEILWNSAEQWQDLRVSGVKIMWSGVFINNNPGKDDVEYIDITHALLEDIEISDGQKETKT